MFKEYANYWKNLFNFKGRARRREYWVANLWNCSIMFLLVGILFCSIMSCVDFTTEVFTPKPIPIVIAVIFGLILAIYYIALMIGTLSLSIRRCHDIGYHWYVFLLCILGSLVCGIGSIVWFVFTIFDSKEDNEWGPNPKNPEINEYDNASGIIAGIIAYIIAIILYVAMVCFSAFGTLFSSGILQDAMNNKTTEAAFDWNKNLGILTTENTTELSWDTTEQTTEAINTDQSAQPAVSGSVNWTDYKIILDGKELTLPCAFTEIEALGYSLDTDWTDPNSDLEASNYTTSCYVKNSAGQTFSIRFVNTSSSTKKVTECEVYGVRIDGFYDAPQAVISGISLGMSLNDVRATLGTEDSLYEGGDGYYSLSYNTENDYFSGMEIAVQDDKVINISLEHMPQ